MDRGTIKKGLFVGLKLFAVWILLHRLLEEPAKERQEIRESLAEIQRELREAKPSNEVTREAMRIATEKIFEFTEAGQAARTAAHENDQ